MGIGPVSAVKKLYQRTGLTNEKIDVFEANEAFAAQLLAVRRELDSRRKERIPTAAASLSDIRSELRERLSP